ncbi:MAG: hypothetical protein EPN46_04235 [Candidimonas sp.]|nr:MAG: hypothetical protein EPN77_03255 [Candidimonas sp.]TAM21199.1 MAG: hypothetical protein EPN62_14955 [Candidimonas sp.]TAM79078.1 MAG: hypothetical protein EPN46_04235 [Candidimonas sp.]
MAPKHRCSLVVEVRYDKRLMYVRFVGTHHQYDKIDVKMI